MNSQQENNPKQLSFVVRFDPQSEYFHYNWLSKDAVVNADGQISSYSREPYSAVEPVVIRVKGRLLPEWGMDETFPTNAADPPLSPAASSQPDVDLELIPYGCARLRISEFPWLKADSMAR